MTAPVTLGASYFDAMYQAAGDPWGFGERWYEQRKYAVSLAQLPSARYRSGFEPGCSIGVLTRQLAARCDTLLACDVAAAAVDAAAGRTRDLAHVRVERREIARQWPPGRFNLVVFSEILYYFGDQDLRQILGQRYGGPRAGRHAARRALAAPGAGVPALRRRRAPRARRAARAGPPGLPR